MEGRVPQRTNYWRPGRAAGTRREGAGNMGLLAAANAMSLLVVRGAEPGVVAHRVCGVGPLDRLPDDPVEHRGRGAVLLGEIERGRDVGAGRGHGVVLGERDV